MFNSIVIDVHYTRPDLGDRALGSHLKNQEIDVGISVEEFGPGMNTQHLEPIARADPPFKAWLLNKNSAQAAETLEADGLRSSQ